MWTAFQTLSVRGVSTAGQHVGGFVRDWMIKFRTLASEVLALVQQEISSESERLSALVRQMPIESVTSRARVDHVPLNRTVLEPKKVRKGLPLTGVRDELVMRDTAHHVLTAPRLNKFGSEIPHRTMANRTASECELVVLYIQRRVSIAPPANSRARHL